MKTNKKALKETGDFLQWCAQGRMPKKWATFAAGYFYHVICEYEKQLPHPRAEE